MTIAEIRRELEKKGENAINELVTAILELQQENKRLRTDLDKVMENLGVVRK